MAAIPWLRWVIHLSPKSAICWICCLDLVASSKSCWFLGNQLPHPSLSGYLYPAALWISFYLTPCEGNNVNICKHNTAICTCQELIIHQIGHFIVHPHCLPNESFFDREELAKFPTLSPSNSWVSKPISLFTQPPALPYPSNPVLFAH